MLKVISIDEAKEIEKRERSIKVPKKYRTPILYPSKDILFAPPEDTLHRYNDYMRRYGDRVRAKEFALIGSHYDAMYRRKVLGSTEAMGVLRDLVDRSKIGDIASYIVRDSDRPDADILYGICDKQVSNGVW